ncbi:MAG: metalloregulator ArsR/SmtB family transcription factor [Clostridia bacterium]
MITNNEQIAKIFKAFCDPKRISIIELLKSGEQCACDITENLDIAQSALSYHMKILCESGVVESWNVGKWTHYNISEQGSAKALNILSELTNVSIEKDCSNEITRRK